MTTRPHLVEVLEDAHASSVFCQKSIEIILSEYVRDMETRCKMSLFSFGDIMKAWKYHKHREPSCST